MSVTAIILSREPIPNKARAKVPQGVQLLNFVSDIKSFKSYQRSWFMAIEKVNTRWFFFLDDDDSLPESFDKLLLRLLSVGKQAALVYTNELLINDAGIQTLLRKEPYSEETHIRRPELCHHLVLARTEVAKQVVSSLPRGNFLPEPMAYFRMAQLGGAVWVDEVGYHWHRGSQGMSYWPDALSAQMASQRWCYLNATERPTTPDEPPAPASKPGPRKQKGKA